MRRTAEWAIFLIGVCLVSTAASNLTRYHAFQRESQTSTKTVSVRSMPARRILGRLEIPRLGISGPVLEGDDEAALSLAAGHVPGTAGLGAPGNTVIAAHRDTFFRALRRIKRGDQITIEAHGSYKYIVDGIRIVSPDNVSALQPSKEPILTLITCYPFRYLGSAPERYVVRARLTQ